MKLVYVLPVLLSIVILSGTQAFAEISTDKDVYMMKDTVIVTGSVEIPKGNSPLILVEVIDSQGNRIGDEALTDDEIFTEGFHVDPDLWTTGEYSVRVMFVEDEYAKDSNYQLQRTGEQIRLGDFEEIVSFQVVSAQTFEPITICRDGDVLRDDGVCISEVSTDDAPTIQDKIEDLTEAEQRINELENRVKELENEKSTLEKANEELQKQVDFLQEQLDNISKQFTDSVTQLNEWFVNQLDR